MKSAAKRSQLTTKHQVSLPPLMVMGEPKILHNMTMTELKVFITVMLKAVYGVPENSTFCFNEYPKPTWWPPEVQWSNQYFDNIPKTENRGCYLRHLITSCYLHYKAEDILYLFDALANESPRWRLSELNDGSYELIKCSTNLPIWHFQNSYRVLTLLALEAKQQSIRESSQKLKAKIFELPLEEGPAKHTRSAPSTSSLSRPPSRESSRDDSCSNEESDSQLMGNASDSPHKSYSIFGDTAKRPSVCIEENEDELLTSPPSDDSNKIKCERCSKVLPSGQDLLQHEVQCLLTTRNQRDKADFLFKLGLIPKSVAEKYKPIKTVPLPRDLTTVAAKNSLAKIPFSSELGKMMLGIHESQTAILPDLKIELRSGTPAYEQYCQPTEASENHERKDMIIDLKTEEMEVSSISPPSSQSLSLICTTNGSTFVPVVYRPPRLITHYHQLKLNKADRLQWWKETYRKGLNDESYEIYKRECKRVKVKVEKLSDEIYAQHCPPQPRTSERQRLMAARRAQSYRCCNDDHHTHDHQPRRKRAKPPLLSSPVRSVTASIALNVKRRTFGMTTLRKRNQFKSLTSCDDNVKAALKGHLARIKKIEHSADHKRLMGPKSKMANRIPMTLEELNWALSNPLPPAPTSRKPSLFRKENPIIVLDKGKVTQLANLIRETKDDEESPYRRFRIQPVSPRKPKDRQQGGKRKKLPNSNPRPQTRFPQRIPNKLMRQHIDRSLLKIKCRPNPGDVMQYRLVKAGGDLKLVPKSQYSETDSAMSPTRNDMFNADIKSDPCTSTAPVTIAENFAKAVEKTAQLAAEKKGKIPPQLNVRPLAYGSSSALWSLAKSASIASKHSKAPSILRRSFKNSPVKSSTGTFDTDGDSFGSAPSSPVKNFERQTVSLMDPSYNSAVNQITEEPLVNDSWNSISAEEPANSTRSKSTVNFVHIAEAEKPAPPLTLSRIPLNLNGGNITVKRIMLPNAKSTAIPATVVRLNPANSGQTGGMATIVRLNNRPMVSIAKPSVPKGEVAPRALTPEETSEEAASSEGSMGYSPVSAIKKMLVCNPRLNVATMSPLFTAEEFASKPLIHIEPTTSGRESPGSGKRKCLLRKPGLVVGDR